MRNEKDQKDVYFCCIAVPLKDGVLCQKTTYIKRLDI